MVSVPPPGGGLQLLLGLKVLENLDLHGRNNNTAEWYESIALVVNVVFRERERWPLYPDRITPSLRKWLLSDECAAEIAATIRSKSNLSPLMVAEEPGETTHLCIVDADGTAVALTQSVQSLFGAKIIGRELGFFYNNYLCTCLRYQHPYELKIHAMPQSNLAPTLVFREGDGPDSQIPKLVVGAAGSRRITSSTLQVITNQIDRGLSLPEALDAPRVHAMLTSKVWIERRIATQKLMNRLSQYFKRIQIKASRSHAMGAVQAFSWDPANSWIGAADPRREGTADGY